MAHINYTRQLRTRISATLEEIMPLSMGGCNFAVFGGTPQQRADAAVQALARYCGRCGILVLLNASDREPAGRLEQLLLQLPRSLPDTHRAFRNTPVRTLPWSGYDLLYGLDEAAICQLMFPRENIHGNTAMTNDALLGLQQYLNIMRYRFQLNSTPFGTYPFNLNLLYQLTSMPYPQLQSQVLSYLPQTVHDSVESVLGRDKVPQQVFSVVDGFAKRFQRFQVLPGDFGAHSRRSIFQSMCSREILCLRVPNSSQTLMDYIEAELTQLSEVGIPFMMLSAELDLINSPALHSRFLRKPSANSYMGILSESMSPVASGSAQQRQIFSHYQQVLVYQCATKDLAEPFSSNCGNYRRTEIQEHHGLHWQPFHLFPGYNTGDAIIKTDERNIRAEELTELGSGVLLMGKQYEPPVRIFNLKQNRGNLNGLFLQTLPPGR